MKLIREKLRIHLSAGVSTYNNYDKNENIVKLAMEDLNVSKSNLRQLIVI